MKTNNRMPRVRGTRQIVAVLANGKSIWLKVHPALVPVREFDHLVASNNRAYDRHLQTFGSNSLASKQLASTIKRDAAKLSRMRQRRLKKLQQRISTANEKRERRIALSLKPAQDQAKADRNQQRLLLRKHGRRDLWNQLVLLSAAPLMAAYGQRSNPFAENNLVVALTLGVWLVGDEISDLLAGKRSIQKGPIRSADIWSYIAPFSNLLTGWWLLNGRQHKRFVTGIADLEDIIQVDDRQGDVFLVVDLSSRIAAEHFPDFQVFKDIPALATIQSVDFESPYVTNATTGTNTAKKCPQVSLFLTEVKQGLLWIGVRVSAQQPKLKQLQVAWAVDTRQPVGPV